jgi:hypothetical protein
LERLARFQRGVEPASIAAAACSEQDALCAARWSWIVRRRPYPKLAFEDLQSAMSLDDPAGPLPIDLLEYDSRADDMADVFVGIRFSVGLELVERAFRPPALPWFCRATSIDLQKGMKVEARSDDGSVWRSLLARGWSEVDARRACARIRLKAERFPDRVRARGDGSLALEAFDDGAWREIAIDDAAPATDAQ